MPHAPGRNYGDTETSTSECFIVNGLMGHHNFRNAARGILLSGLPDTINKLQELL